MTVSNYTPSHTRSNTFVSRLSTLIAGVLLMILAAGCGSVNLVSIEDEWEMGREIEAELNRQLTLVNDRDVQQYITEIGMRIVSTTDMANLPWSFYVVADPAVNAFNTPGGNVYVYTGLITAADNVAELASVIAHEVAHGVARHGTRQMSAAYGINLGAGLLLGNDPGLVQQIAAQVAATGAMANFSRSDEREADQMAIDFMYDAGYDPNALATFFEKLMSANQREPGAVAQFFSTHPLTSDRIDDARRRAARYSNTQRLVRTDSRLQSIQQRVRGYN